MQSQQQIQTKLYGNATFKKIVEADQQFIELIQLTEIQNVLNQLDWYIHARSYIINKWKQIFQYMVRCEAQSLGLYNNQYPQIINQIQNVKFTNLRFLYLSGNNINNIETLNFIKCFNLAYLDISQNSISQIKCMSKFKMPFLQDLFLNQNPINQIISLTRGNFNQDHLYLDLEREIIVNRQQEINLIQNDLSVFVKLSTKSLKKLMVMAQNRVKQFKVYKLLEEKYPLILLQHLDFN